MQTKEFDVIICGAGMTGATLALLLSLYRSQPLKIALVEANPLNYGHHPGFDSRAIALSAGSIKVFKAAQCWPQLAPYAQSIEHILVSDRGHLGQVEMHADDYPLKRLGAVIELAHAGRVLHQKLAQLDHVQLFCPQRVTDITTSQDQQLVTLNDGQKLSARLLVGADGGTSQVAKQMRLDTQTLHYGQSALIANVTSQLAHQGRAFERFTEHGPVALLPMTEQRWSLVWCVPHEQADYWRTCSEDEFLQELQHWFGYRVGRFLHVGHRDAYPLTLIRRPVMYAHRSALLGNAAHSLHPIAGQGFNLGIRDAHMLAQLVTQSADPGAFDTLAQYQQCRYQDVSTTVGLTSALALGFSNRDPLSVVIRNSALMTMQHSKMAKTPFVRQTLGLGHA